MIDWYDRKGNRISIFEAAALSELPGYRRVAETIFEDGRKLSTVWMGLNHQLGQGPPLIFESMLFSAETRTSTLFPDREFHEELGQWRYSTEIEALAGHEAIVAQLRPAITLDQLITGG